ncbi:MAG: hypothetical protein LC541_06390 [Candidatus Thiodiazotropha sp.]|nr:hypothetical protein [Candidatus Thiodiazotropha sp.]MCM8882946.1 hypothetical protein [Candidatus Thiodiazotropha sp.]MCM8921196.1 hypothetical protein [Candidatus Thiodiazotropha sp.]
MTISRKKQICLEETPYYHCISCCDRRAYLCCEDKFSANNYEHRRDWLVGQLRKITNIFAIDICAYAVMQNHTHTAEDSRYTETVIICSSQIDHDLRNNILEHDYCIGFLCIRESVFGSLIGNITLILIKNNTLMLI